MPVLFKKMLRKDPLKPTDPGKYYPQLVSSGKAVLLPRVAHLIKERSSLSVGDIKSVLANFVEVMREQLFSGNSVNIENFGVFSLTAHADGVLVREECTAQSIRSLSINYRPSSSVRPNLKASATRADGEKIDFQDVEYFGIIVTPEEGGESGIDPREEQGV